MKTKILCSAFAALALVAVAGCGKRDVPAAPAAAVVVKGAVVQTVKEQTVPEIFVAVGTVKPRNSAQVSARLAGVVTQVTVREGERVGKGKLLVAIEAAEQNAGAAAARAAVEEARRSLDEARSRLRLAETTHGRFLRLFQEQAATRQEMDSRQAELEIANQGVSRAEARLQQAQENSVAAGAVAGYGRVSAPVSGLIAAKSVEVGMTVFPGMPLLTIEGDGGYRLEAAVPENLVSLLKTGQRVAVAVDGASVAASGSIAEIMPAADPATRTVTVKIDLIGKGIKGGQFGRVSLPTDSRSGIVVPKSAVIERGSLTSLWIVGKDRIARLRLVKTGKMFASDVEILTGLSAGEVVIVSGQDRVVDGARIE